MNTRTAVALGLGLAFAVTACGDSADDELEASDIDGSISMAVTEPEILIPGRQSVAFDFGMAVWSPLIYLELDGELNYIQAESVESDDQTTWTITLREGWTFHDGSPVTAQDYIDSWNAVAYGPNAFENSGQLANIVGFDDLNPAEGEPETDEMEGLNLVDELTFEVELVGPDSQFPVQLTQAQTALFPMPPSAFEDFDAYNEHPIGNGQFAMVDTYVESEPITVRAYEDYAGDPPNIGEITFVAYSDQVTAYTDALAGNIDVSGVPANRRTQAEDDFGADRNYNFEAPGMNHLGLPLWDERYDDIRVRQAISLAIDRETINDVVFGGAWEPATAWTPAVMPGTPEGICGEYCEYDPEAAAELLEEAGGFEGDMEIVFPGGSGQDDYYNAIANNIRQNLGIEAVAAPTVDWAEFAERRENAEIDGPFFSRWGALYPSQQATIREMYLETGGCTNCVPMYLPEIEEALAEADATGDESGEAYAAVHEILQENFPVVPMFFETYSYATSERVEELVTQPGGNPRLSHIVLVDED
ncbi:peptide ABC transporter substrate-binding protein [Nesterenkonia muleiensis]|uniref:peptide ABC transporter substrate-binding protein n=1 Tax=Nesterenkonia muleiensis TaxID=2282648 RepID=UPI000E73B774|nr:ABC transporter substrate-binding protein [Nesterenkonia muleiensis]